MTVILFTVLAHELVFDDGATLHLVVVDEVIELYSDLQADFIYKIIDEPMGTGCDILLLFLLGPYCPSYNQVSAILSMNL